MRFSYLSAGAIALLLVSVLALAASGGAAAAQEGGANATDETYEIAIDEQTRIVSSEWDGATVTIVVESDVARRVAVTDASQEIDGTIDIRRTQATVAGDERTTIEFTVKNRENAAVTVQAGGGIVGVGKQSGGGYDPDPVPFGGVLVLIGIASVGTGGLTFWTVRNRRETDEKTAERVA